MDGGRGKTKKDGRYVGEGKGRGCRSEYKRAGWLATLLVQRLSEHASDERHAKRGFDLTEVAQRKPWLLDFLIDAKATFRVR